MANVRTVSAGDIVQCDVRGEVFFAEVEVGPKQVSPRVYEIGIRRIGGFGQRSQVRGRQVRVVYRKLKS